MLKDPIIEDCCCSCKTVAKSDRFGPEKNMNANKEVTFVFLDGTSAVLTTECDHKTFTIKRSKLET